jgi:mRNA interferase MazF
VSDLLRGTVWEYGFAEGEAPKPALIVSNNARNRSAFPSVHVVRLTTAPKPPRETIVDLPSQETLRGQVICDDLALVRKDRLGRRLGAMSPTTMRRVDDALRVVLAL